MNLRVDAHHHLWDLAVRDQPWITGEAMAPIRRNFGVADLAEVAEGCSVEHTVVVQAVPDVDETVELLALAAATSLISGVVGYVDLAAADVGDQLDRLRDLAGGDRLVGIRNLVQDEPDPHWLLRPAVLAGLQAVAARDLVYDLLVTPSQLAAATAAVERIPHGRFVVDHAAKPPVATGRREPWATALRSLAANANVSCKLSGLVTEADWQRWSLDDLRPYADHVVDCFGPSRLLFGTDWPVCTLAAPYDEVVEAAEQLLVGLTAGERDAVFGANATETYRLRHRSMPERVGVAS